MLADRGVLVDATSCSQTVCLLDALTTVPLMSFPQGTSDEHLAVVENLRTYKPDGAVLVTTPQGVALNDVRREASFCKKARLPILGIIENMSGFVCPHCSVSPPLPLPRSVSRQQPHSV